MGADKYDKTLQLEKHINMIRPISYFIRCILAAASILAHPNFTKPEEQELAKSVIDRKYTVTKEMVELECSPSGAIGIDFMDIHTPDEHAPVALEVPDFECKQFEWKNGILQQGMDWKFAEITVSGNSIRFASRRSSGVKGPSSSFFSISTRIASLSINHGSTIVISWIFS